MRTELKRDLLRELRDLQRKLEETEEAAEEMAGALKGLVAQIQNGFYQPVLEKYDEAYEGGKALGSAVKALARWEGK